MDETQRLAPHGGCWWEGCTICNTPHNPYPTSWKRTKDTSVEVKGINLTPEQFVWVMGLNYRTDSGWETDKGNNGKYQDNLELKIQVWVKSNGTVQITVWE